MEYYSVQKKLNNATCGKMNGPRDFDSKPSKSEKDKYHMTSLIIQKNNTNELIYKTETDS